MKNTVTYAQVEEIAEMAVSQEVQPIKAEIPHLQGRIDKLESELETVRINCADCDAVISAPWLKPSECPDCGMGLNWSAFEEAEVQ
jgi:predicted Zn-ribbon and HTH transcriptional regulator